MVVKALYIGDRMRPYHTLEFVDGEEKPRHDRGSNMPNHDLRKSTAEGKVHWVLFDKSDGAYLLKLPYWRGNDRVYWGEERSDAKKFESYDQAKKCRDECYDEKTVKVRRITRKPKAQKYVIAAEGDDRLLSRWTVAITRYSYNSEDPHLFDTREEAERVRLYFPFGGDGMVVRPFKKPSANLHYIKNVDGRYLCEFEADRGGFSFGWGTKDEAMPLKKDEADAFLEFAKKKSVYAGELCVEEST